MSLTVAIPTMERWSFLNEQLPKFLGNPRVSYVVINDENGKDINIICEIGLDSNPKLRLYSNDAVLGVYGNKRQCLLNAPSEWVAVLDSLTSYICISRDGTVYKDIDKNPKPPAHYNCRSTITYLVNGKYNKGGKGKAYRTAIGEDGKEHVKYMPPFKMPFSD